MKKLRCSYSRKQIETIHNFAKQKHVIHSGPFGVGKTKCLVEAFGIYCAKLQEMGTTGLTFVLAGRTLDTVHKNMCNVLTEQFGSDYIESKSKADGKTKDAVLFGQYLYFIGFNDVTARAKFQGISDIMGILHDECTLCTQEQFDYAYGRLRGEVNIEGAEDDAEPGEYIEVEEDEIDIKEIKIPTGTVAHWYIGSCNPDAPNHFIKKYIDTGLFENVRWRMRDAIWNGARAYYEDLKRQFKGNKAFTLRYLDGEWAATDKMVYSMFNPSIHVISDVTEAQVTYSSLRETFISIDYGSDHPTAILVISKGYDGNYVVTREKPLRATAPSQIVLEIEGIMQSLIDRGANLTKLYIDPSAKALKDEMTLRGLTYMNALNSHADGIGKVQSLFSTNCLFILAECEGLLGEIYTYRYKDTTSGKDEVVKIGDDFVDALRYGVHTNSMGL